MMNDYELHISAGVDPIWITRFSQPSDEMARDYAERVLTKSPVAANAYTALLFNIAADKLVTHWEMSRITQARQIDEDR